MDGSSPFAVSFDRTGHSLRNVPGGRWLRGRHSHGARPGDDRPATSRLRAIHLHLTTGPLRGLPAGPTANLLTRLGHTPEHGDARRPGRPGSPSPCSRRAGCHSRLAPYHQAWHSRRRQPFTVWRRQDRHRGHGTQHTITRDVNNLSEGKQPPSSSCPSASQQAQRCSWRITCSSAARATSCDALEVAWWMRTAAR